MLPKNTDHVYGYVLEVLTTGLYPNNLDVIREYIQNGYDAIQTLRDLGGRGSEEIRINIENNSVVIHDSGIGMDRSTVEKYRYFGYSEKVTTKNTGFRGIGKLAGLSVANDLEVITSKYGIPYQYKIKFSASKMLLKVIEGKKVGINYPLNELILEHTLIEEYAEESESHYTKVILHDIKDDAKELLEFETVKNHISEVMPVEFNKNQFNLAEIISNKLEEDINNYRSIEIFLNDEKIYKPYKNSDGLSGLQFFEIFKEDNTTELVAYGWVVKNGHNSKAIPNDLVKNIRVFYKGFRIGDRNLLTSVLFSSGRQFLSQWFAGEIYVFDENLIPTSARDNFESNSARTVLYDTLRNQIGRKLDKIANQTSQNNSVHKEIGKTEKFLQNVESLSNKSIPKEVISLKKKEIDERVKTLKKKVENNKSNLTSETEKKAIEAINNLLEHQKVIQEIEEKESSVEINFSPNEKQVYEIMVKTIKTYFKKNNIAKEEELITHAYKKLEKAFGVKKIN